MSLDAVEHPAKPIAEARVIAKVFFMRGMEVTKE
jgi:hypothetical protein